MKSQKNINKKNLQKPNKKNMQVFKRKKPRMKFEKNKKNDH